MAGLTILACQIDVTATPDAAARDRHLDVVARKIRARLEERAHDLVVLPELSSIEYSRANFENLDVLAEPLDGSSFQRFSRLAREFGCAIVYGIARRSSGFYCITQVAVDGSDTPIGHFDKLHLAQYGASMEREYFRRGDHLLIFRHRDVAIAPIICYDIRMPELTRTLAVEHGTQLVLHCSAHARDESFYSWHHFAVCRAMENQIFFLSLNRAGDYYGDSLFCTPWVDESSPGIRFRRTAEEFKTIEIDTTLIGNVRREYSLLHDRMCDYSALVPLGRSP